MMLTVIFKNSLHLLFSLQKDIIFQQKYWNPILEKFTINYIEHSSLWHIFIVVTT